MVVVVVVMVVAVVTVVVMVVLAGLVVAPLWILQHLGHRVPVESLSGTDEVSCSMLPEVLAEA